MTDEGYGAPRFRDKITVNEIERLKLRAVAASRK
jgi:hypothetical protein